MCGDSGGRKSGDRGGSCFSECGRYEDTAGDPGCDPAAALFSAAGAGRRYAADPDS